ncbi:MAG: alternate-type signal peptide domain-containing protein [Micrococcales bacterium]|nr:alternate-type signal peptide domain-containing protein [Micrococcales bacterium]
MTDTMTDPTTGASLIVVTEDRRRRRSPWVAAAAVALLLGGSTLALWSAKAEFSDGEINSGDLNMVRSDGDTKFYDVSADRTDATVTLAGTDGSQPGHEVDLVDWVMVPGDKIAAVFSVDITLAGDNLVARLSVDVPDVAPAGPGVPPAMTWTYEVYQEGVALFVEQDLTADGAMYLSSADGADDSVDPHVVALASNDPQRFTVVVYGTFDADARDGAVSAYDLKGVSLHLDQVRDTGALFG